MIPGKELALASPANTLRSLICHWQLYAVLVLSQALPTSGLAQSEWALADSRDRVRVYLREHPGSDLPSFRAVTELSASLASVVAVLLDVPAFPEWFHRCSHSQTLAATGANEELLYQRHELPFARDRDLLLRARLDYSDEGRHIQLHLQSAPDYCREHACPELDSSPLRIREFSGRYDIRQLREGRVEISWEQHLEPGGALPAWLVRSGITEVPLQSLIALREQVRRPRYSGSRLEFNKGLLRVVHSGLSPDEQQ